MREREKKKETAKKEKKHTQTRIYHSSVDFDT